MLALKIEQIIEATGGTLLQCGSVSSITAVNTDSRKEVPNSIFIPLVGERFDGHEYILQSVEGGADVVVISKTGIAIPKEVTVIEVEDTTKALQELASYYRSLFDIKVVAVTGSVGKTSTKDLIYSALATHFKTLKTEGNFNNEIGLPLTLFRLEQHHEVAVLEMGMNHFGEIHRLSEIAKPDIAVITNIGMSHIENLGSREGILQAKCEIFDFISQEGKAILNGDDSLLRTKQGDLPVDILWYSTQGNGDFNSYEINSLGEEGSKFKLDWNGVEYEVLVPKPGVHMVQNALSAIAVGTVLQVPIEKLIQGIKLLESTHMRMDIVKLSNEITILNDAYNASPDSMNSALQVLKEIGKSGRTIAVLGDMLEMGSFAPAAHQSVGEYVVKAGIDLLVTKGELAKNIALGALQSGMDHEQIFSFASNEDALECLKGILQTQDTILVKGSRGMRMEQIVNGLKEGA